MTPVSDVLHHWAPSFVSYAGAMLVQSSLVILLLLAADVLLRHRVRPAIRYAIWMLALVKLLLPPALASPTSPAYWLPEDLRAVADTAAPVPAESADPVPGETADPVPGDAATDAGRTAALPAPVGRTAPLAQPGRAAISTPVVLFAVWMGGVLVLVARIVRTGRAVQRLIAIADAPSPDLVALIDECRRQLGVKRPIDARCTSLAHVPAIVGFWNPVILVPAPLLASLTSAQLRAVLLHEVAHCKRGDVWVDSVQALVQVVHWYNPLVWVTNSVIRQVREQAVDEVVLMHMGETPEVYPETLLHVARMVLLSPARVRVAGVPVLERGTGLKRRITRMLEAPTPSTVRVGIWNALLIGAAALIVLPMAPRAASVARALSVPPAASVTPAASLPRAASVVQGNPCESTSDSGRDYLFYDPALYAKHKAQWLACVESRPSDVTVIERAGDFVEFINPGLARTLYERASALESQDSRWRSKLLLHRLSTEGRAAALEGNLGLEVAERALAQGKPCESLNGNPFASFYLPLYAKLKEQWLACIEASAENVEIIESAADFVKLRDPALARELLERAHALEPLQTYWPLLLARLDAWQLRALEFPKLKPAERATRALQAAERERAAMRRPGLAHGRFLIHYGVTHTQLPQLAFDAGDMVKARAYAEELLAKSQREDRNSSRDGSEAVHHGNLVLGRIAVREGKLSEAITFLQRSADMSSYFWTHGPNMSLAKDLLEAGETAAVLTYFEQCRRIEAVSMGPLGELLDLWAAEVRAGYVPKFGTSLHWF